MPSASSIKVTNVNRLITSRILKGKVLFQDDMEGSNLANKYHTTGGSGIDTTYLFMHDQSFKIDSGAGAGSIGGIRKSIPLPIGDSKIGVEFYFLMENDADSDLEFLLRFESKNRGYSYRKEAGIKISWLSKPRYLNASNNFVVFPDSYGTKIIDFGAHDGIHGVWHNTGLIVDFDNLRYKKFWLDDVIVSFNEEIATTTNSAAYYDALWLYIRCRTNKASSQYCYIDSIIVTQEE